jgi:hypothetical protein
LVIADTLVADVVDTLVADIFANLDKLLADFVDKMVGFDKLEVAHKLVVEL